MMECVSFLGQIPRGKPVIEQLDAADLFVLPSFTEGLPRSLIEAMARGLPCLASNVGGIPELLASEDLMPPGDVATLAAKIESVIRNSDRLQKMAYQNIQTAREYRADELNRRRVDFYKRLKEVTEAYVSSKKH
jgi:glycosyltransferase involved in cell wall biosynthesis